MDGLIVGLTVEDGLTVTLLVGVIDGDLDGVIVFDAVPVCVTVPVAVGVTLDVDDVEALPEFDGRILELSA